MENYFLVWKMTLPATLATWYISIIPAVLVIFLSLLLYFKTKPILENMGDEIRSYADLAPIRQAINFNMKLAFFLMPVYGLFFGMVAVLVIQMGINPFTLVLAGNHLIFMLIVTVAFAVPSGYKSEKKIKKMKVAADAPHLKTIFEDWLKQWKRPKWSLKERDDIPGNSP